MEKQLKLNTRKLRRASLEKRKAMSGYLFVAPFILGIILVYLPILIDSIWFSFNYKGQTIINGVPVTEYTNVGIEYYKYAFVESPDFTTKLLEGLQQLVLEVPAVVIFSLFVAVVLNQKMLGRAAFRAIFFVPVIISTGLMDALNASNLAVSSTEGGIDDGSGTGGIISALDIEAIVKSMDISFAGNLVTYVVDLVNNIYNIINYSGVQMLIFLAGLQSISPAIYEASKIEGATGWETFWKITFPMISPMILVNAIYSIIDSFTRSTNKTMAYIAGVGKMHLGHASAMYWIYFVIVILILAIVAGVISTFVFYQRKD